MSKGLVIACIGLATMVGAGGAYFALNELRPPKPQVVHQAPPKAGEQIVQPFGPVPYIVIKEVPAPTPAPAAKPEPAPAAVEKKVVKPQTPVKKKKRKPSPAKKLQSKWQAPKSEPNFIERFFNVR